MDEQWVRSKNGQAFLLKNFVQQLGKPVRRHTTIYGAMAVKSLFHIWFTIRQIQFQKNWGMVGPADGRSDVAAHNPRQQAGGN